MANRLFLMAQRILLTQLVPLSMMMVSCYIIFLPREGKTSMLLMELLDRALVVEMSFLGARQQAAILALRMLPVG